MGGKIVAVGDLKQAVASSSSSAASSPETVNTNERSPKVVVQQQHACLGSSESVVDGGGFPINGVLASMAAAAADLSSSRYQVTMTTALKEEEGVERQVTMSLNSGDERDSAPEGIVVAVNHHHQQQQQTCGSSSTVPPPLVNGVCACASSLEMVERNCKTQGQQVVVEYNTQLQQQQQQSGMRIYDSQMSSSYSQGLAQPPTLVLPDQSMVDKEFAVMQQMANSDGLLQHHQQHANGLPAYLIVSPPSSSCHDGKQMVLDHNGKQVLLDPNAREYTPPPQSLCAAALAPVLPPAGVLHMAVPTPYHIEQARIFTQGVVDVGQLAPSQMVYGGGGVADYGVAGPLVPLFCNNGGAVSFAPGTGALSTTSWEHLGMPDIVQQHHQGSAGSSVGIHVPMTPAIGLGQPVHSLPVQQQHPYAAASMAIQPFISMGCPTMTFSGNNSLASTQQPSVSGREHVSRALLLNGVPSGMDEHQLKQEMELWGPVRAMGMERIKEGLVIVHYYDLRHTKEALADIQQQHLWYQQRMQRQLQRQQQHHCSAAGSSSSLPSESRHHDRQERAAAKHAENRGGPDDSSSWGGGDVQGMTTTTRGLIAGKVMWAQYTVAVGAAAGADGLNQGTLVVFNLDAEMSLETLQAAFEKYGTVKELRETPAKKMHKFVEFYDVRDAAKALKALDNQEIGGKKVKIEFSRPGGQAYKARVQAQQAQVQNQQQNAPPLFAGGGGGASNQSSILGTAAAGGGGPAPLYVSWNADCTGAPSQAIASVAGPQTGPPYLWTGYGPIPGGTPLSPIGLVHHPQQWNSLATQMQSLSYGPAMPPTVPQGQGSGGVSLLMSVEHSLPFGRGGGSGRTTIGTTGYNSGFSSAAAGTVVGDNCVSLVSESLGREENSLASQTRGGDGPVPAGRRKRNLANSSSGFGKCEPMIHLQGGSGGGKMMGSRDGPSSTGRSCLPMKCLSNESVPLQYMFDEKELQSDESTRTTLMIRNIPNKYSQAMLLQLLDRHCLHSNSHLEDPNEPESAYDFVYLPIDFKNRCNLGYAFVNFTTVEATKRLYKAFHAQQWEAFNSRKVCQVSYARVQGRVALEEHFRNSRFACDNDEYLPLCFSPPRTGGMQSQPTVAAGHLVGRAMGSSSTNSSHNFLEEQGCAHMTRNGDTIQEGGHDENNTTKRVSANSRNDCSQHQEIDVSGVHGRVIGRNWSSDLQQQQQRR